MMNWNNLIELIESHQRFIISSHQSLDGDSIGSQLAMLWYLRSRGKEVVVYNTDPVPRKFMFLENVAEISTVQPASFTPDVLCVLDCSHLYRLGWKAEGSAPVIINIDHHRDNGRFGTLNYVDDHAAATGALLYRFFKESNITIPPFVAEALYAAIMTDTGGFRFSNTSSTILRISADLIDLGAECSKIYEKVYSSHTPQGLALQARVWSSLTYHLGGKVCSMVMPTALLDEIGAVYSDSEGMVDHTVTAEGVEVGLMVKHSPTSSHFSLRSTGRIDVGKVAQTIPGGGGHFSAAGCTLDLPFEKAFPYMLDILNAEIG